jgi:hypothetical protein
MILETFDQFLVVTPGIEVCVLPLYFGLHRLKILDGAPQVRFGPENTNFLPHEPTQAIP